MREPDIERSHPTPLLRQPQFPQPNPMTTHPRHVFASIDNVKLDKLAELAVRVGLRLQAGQDLFLTAPVAALPLVRLDGRFGRNRY